MKQILFTLGFILSLPAYAEKCTWCVAEDATIQKELAELSKKKPKEALDAVRAKNVCVQILKSGRRVPHKFFAWRNAEVPKGELSSITSTPALMGKTLCAGEHEVAKDCTTIILASDAPLSTLYHEYLHVKQIERDNSWCAISKKLWKEQPSEADNRALHDREWDLHKLLWLQRDQLNFGLEDKVAIADETLKEVEARKAYDPSAQKFADSEKIAEKLKAYIADYMKAAGGS